MLLFYSEHVIYECFKTCLQDIFMHNNVTFKIYQRRPAASTRRRRHFPLFFAPPPTRLHIQILQCAKLSGGPLNLPSAPPPPPPTPCQGTDSTRRSLSWTERGVQSCLCCGLLRTPPVGTCSGSLVDEQTRDCFDSIFIIREDDETPPKRNRALPPFCLTF